MMELLSLPRGPHQHVIRRSPVECDSRAERPDSQAYQHVTRLSDNGTNVIGGLHREGEFMDAVERAMYGQFMFCFGHLRTLRAWTTKNLGLVIIDRRSVNADWSWETPIDDLSLNTFRYDHSR